MPAAENYASPNQTPHRVCFLKDGNSKTAIYTFKWIKNLAPVSLLHISHTTSRQMGRMSGRKRRHLHTGVLGSPVSSYSGSCTTGPPSSCDYLSLWRSRNKEPRTSKSISIWLWKAFFKWCDYQSISIQGIHIINPIIKPDAKMWLESWKTTSTSCSRAPLSLIISLVSVSAHSMQVSGIMKLPTSILTLSNHFLLVIWKQIIQASSAT